MHRSGLMPKGTNVKEWLIKIAGVVLAIAVLLILRIVLRSLMH